MTYLTFKKKIRSEKGAVEFIESSLVLSVILLMISLLILITLMTIVAIRDGEISYGKSLDLIYHENIPSFNSLSDSNTSNSYKFNKSKNIFATKVNFTNNENLEHKISRVDTEGLLRKVDFVNEVAEEIEERTGVFSKVKSKILQYKDSIKKFMGQKNEK